jgi:hypothetical protein
MDSRQPLPTPSIDARFQAAALGWDTQYDVTQAWIVRDRILTAQLSTVCTKLDGLEHDLKDLESLRERFYRSLHDIESLKNESDRQDKRHVADVQGHWQIRVALIASLTSLLGVLGTMAVTLLK